MLFRASQIVMKSRLPVKMETKMKTLVSRTVHEWKPPLMVPRTVHEQKAVGEAFYESIRQKALLATERYKALKNKGVNMTKT